MDEFVAPLVETVSQGFEQLANAARGAAGDYEVTDEDLKSDIETSFKQ
ncbi:hypothetical protein M1L58_18775 [Gordonia sp. C13]|nr:hypothetical protein [Gordonia sp. C13]MCK8615885.1 hypothetical protein [Gordonia sp. C13]